MNINSILPAAAIIAFTAISSGCANSSANYEPIVDGERSTVYYADVQTCQSLATQLKHTNGDVKSEAAAVAIAGVIFGAIDEGTEGAIAGSIVGSALGASGRAWDTREECKQIVIECIKQRGHRVVG